MAATKTKAETKNQVPALRAAAAKVPAKVPAPQVDADGFEKTGGGAVPEAEGFLAAEDIQAQGSVIQGKLLGAFLMPDDKFPGQYRAVYTLQLELPVGRYADGSIVNLGEKHKLKPLRAYRVGQDVRLTVGETKKIGGGKTMVSFDIAARPFKGTAPTLGQMLIEAGKSTTVDPWNCGPGIGATPPVEGEDVPF